MKYLFLKHLSRENNYSFKLPTVLAMFFFLTVVFSFSAGTRCKYPEKKEPLRIAVASNVQFAMAEIKKDFERTSDIRLQLIVGNTRKLSAQIKNGAPYHVFLAANMTFPEKLHESGYAITRPKAYADGALVLWTYKKIPKLNIKLLATNKIKKIAIANPDNAPHGQAALKLLKSHKFYDKIEKKLVYGKGIAEINRLVSKGQADVALTSKSIVLSPRVKSGGTYKDLNKSNYSRIKQGIVLLKPADGVPDALHFYNYVFSKNAQDILRKFGYNPLDEAVDK